MTNSPLSNLPHAEPFRFVSSVEELEAGRRAVATWRVSGKEDFLRGHFPGNPVVPGVLLAEALAQLSGVLAFAGEMHGRSARLASVDVKFPAAVVPPADVRLESTLTRALADLHLFDVRALAHGSVVAVGTLVLAAQPGGPLFSGAAARSTPQSAAGVSAACPAGGVAC